MAKYDYNLPHQASPTQIKLGNHNEDVSALPVASLHQDCGGPTLIYRFLYSPNYQQQEHFIYGVTERERERERAVIKT